jgi:hypothetical protein
MKQFLYLIGILIVVTACKEVYEAPPQAMLQASFYNSTTNKPVSSQATVQGIGLDSLLVYETSINEVLLPLTVKDTTHYIIWFDSKSDFITFIHETTLKYASMESGFYYEYKLRSVGFTQNRIDSVEIIDSLVTTKWHENIKLYIHPLSVSGN